MGILEIYRFKHCLCFFQCFYERFKHCLLESTKKGEEKRDGIHIHIILPKNHIQKKIHDNFHITLWDVLFSFYLMAFHYHQVLVH